MICCGMLRKNDLRKQMLFFFSKLFISRKPIKGAIIVIMEQALSHQSIPSQVLSEEDLGNLFIVCTKEIPKWNFNKVDGVFMGHT